MSSSIRDIGDTLTATLDYTSFADDPVVSCSGQFPLGRIADRNGVTLPSAAEIRPWGLRGMRAATHQGDFIQEAFSYDHADQVSVSRSGIPLTMASAKKVTSNDGDEGPSEDFTYDFVPDSPDSV